jgi:tyrosyl-tRNA synthetase
MEMEDKEARLSPELKEQLDTLMRGTFFADEVESGQEQAAGRQGLRSQMREELADKLQQGRPLRVYLGVDPTASSLHIGHLVPVLKLRQFQDYGHHVVFLIGDYTGLIGDPSGRAQARKQMDADTLKKLSEGYEEQVFKILDPEKTEVRRNSEWLTTLGFADVIRLAAQFPLKQIVARRDFQQRMERGESLRFHEALYALMQGYDAYALECDVQVGGYDQYFNLLAGRVIQEHFGQKPHVMITVPLIPGTDGRKMSKSYGNAINVTDSPRDMYGKVMRIEDSLMHDYLQHACLLSTDEIEKLEAKLRAPDGNPMEVKKRLAFEVTKLYHGEGGAEQGQKTFERLSQRREKPPEQEIPEYDAPAETAEGTTSWPVVMAELGLVQSRGAAKRLMKGGGFKVDGEAVRDREAIYDPTTPHLVQYGKRKFARIKPPGGSTE